MSLTVNSAVGAGPVDDVEAVVRCARRVGVAPMLVELLADPSQPCGARERALGHVMSALAASGSAPFAWGDTGG